MFERMARGYINENRMKLCFHTSLSLFIVKMKIHYWFSRISIPFTPIEFILYNETNHPPTYIQVIRLQFLLSFSEKTVLRGRREGGKEGETKKKQTEGRHQAGKQTQTE